LVSLWFEANVARGPEILTLTNKFDIVMFIQLSNRSIKKLQFRSNFLWVNFIRTLVVKASATGKLANWIADQHERYGDIISLQTGWITFVMVKDGNLMKELYNSEDFKYRPLHFPLLRQLINGRDGAGKKTRPYRAESVWVPMKI